MSSWSMASSCPLPLLSRNSVTSGRAPEGRSPPKCPATAASSSCSSGRPIRTGMHRRMKAGERSRPLLQVSTVMGKAEQSTSPCETGTVRPGSSVATSIVGATPASLASSGMR
ncbi:hypothetical protein HFP72_18590 [Nocardiopsis sp. ARC36]